MCVHRHSGPDVVNKIEIDVRRDDAIILASGIAEDPTPGIDNHRPAVRRKILVGMRPPLGGSSDIRLRLDRARAQQHFPMRFSGRRREIHGQDKKMSATSTQGAPDSREPEVVADQHSHGEFVNVGCDELAAAIKRFRFEQAKIGKIDVEEMDLPVHGGQLAVRRDEERGVEELLAAGDSLRKRTAVNPNPELRSKARDETREPPRQVIGLGIEALPAIIRNLRKHEHPRSGRGAFANQLLELREVDGLIIDRVELDDTDFHRTNQNSFSDFLTGYTG